MGAAVGYVLWELIMNLIMSNSIQEALTLFARGNNTDMLYTAHTDGAAWVLKHNFWAVFLDALFLSSVGEGKRFFPSSS